MSLDIRENEIVGLIGESGSGKSTIGRLLLGLLQPSAGKVTIDGLPVSDAPRGSIGAVLQNPDWALNPRLRVDSAIAEPLRVGSREGKPDIRGAVNMALDQVGLTRDLGRRFPSQLSGGQRQRASIARALIAKPRLLLLDEPVSALDALVQEQVMDLLRQLHEELGFTALFISHDLEAVRGFVSRIAVLRVGQIVETGDAVQFYAGPQHPYSRALLAAVKGEKLSLIDGQSNA